MQGVHAAHIERENRGYKWLWPGVPPVSVVPMPMLQGTRTFVRQEQPWHLPNPCSFTRGPMFLLPPPPLQGTRTFVAQEQPWHNVPSNVTQSSMRPTTPTPGANTSKGYIL